MIALDNKPLYVEGNTAKVWPDSANEPYTAPLTATIDDTDVTIGHKDVNIGGSANIEKIAGNTIKWNQLLKEGKLVDMGLPSGTLWASCNIDVTQEDGFAASPFQYKCSFFSWGNIDGHNPINNNAFDYDFGNINAQEPWYEGQVYGETNGNTLTSDIPVGEAFDAARKHLGAPWRMPTTVEFLELFNNSKFIDANGDEVSSAGDKRVTIGGVTGIYIESKLNGARLFFSCSGYGRGSLYYYRESTGTYWSSTWSSARYARYLDFTSGGVYPNGAYRYRYYGFAVRPVLTHKLTPETDGNGHKFIQYGNNITDLTLIYGANKEPATAAEFETWREENIGLENHYPYDKGSLIPTKATHIHTDIEDKEINITTLEGTKGDGTKEVMFPDGLKRVGDVYDEINYAEGKAIKRIGVVDLGTLDYEKSTSGLFRTSGIGRLIKRPATNMQPTGWLLNLHYTEIDADSLYGPDAQSPSDDMMMTENIEGLLYFNNMSYTDTTDFKTAMRGVLLYYELATPIEYKLDPVQPKKVVYREDPDNVTVKEIYKGTNLVWANYYGWDYNESTGTLTRIGNPEWHKTLPIQSQMRKAVISDNGTKKFISSINPDLYEDGTKADYSGKDGQVMTRLPKYNFSSYEYTDTNNIVHKVLKLYPYDNLGKVSPEVWFGSFEGIVDKETDRKLYSISLIENMPAKIDGVYLAADFASANVYTSDVDDYRCGSADSHTSSDGLVSTRRGRPATNYSITAFRGYAANRGTGWTQQYWTAYNSLCRLYTVEYCSFNSQAAYNNLLTADGYHQGGLGAGVTDANSNRWNAFNDYNPFIPCGITKELGNNTGVIGFKFADGEFGNEQYGTAQYTTYVPCYRGIENPFGHIWKWTDGIHHVGDSTNSVGRIYATDDITKFANGTADEPLIDGYTLRTEIPYTNGNIRDWLWDENGDFIPTQTTGTTRIPDYAYLAYNGYHALRSGGGAFSGAIAGLFCFYVGLSASSAYASVGSRLLYTPLS